MTAIAESINTQTVTVEIGGIPIALRTSDVAFCDLLMKRYAGFVSDSAVLQCEMNVDLEQPWAAQGSDDDVQVRKQGSDWLIERGDFRARWNPENGRGEVRQSHNPYAIDSVLRIMHTLILAEHGGFLFHAASAIRGDRAFLFAGVSGAGKTTISRLAPPDVGLFSDEISYVRRHGDRYFAYGTPFSGELAKSGENQSAPLATFFLLGKGPKNRIEAVSKVEAVRSLLRNVLFFAEDRELVAKIFESACEFADRVPIRRLVFRPDAQVWENIH
jgi:hypothetical protein